MSCAVNIAVALANLQDSRGQQLKIGILDADVYGPSVPHLMGLSGQPKSGAGDIAV